MTTPAAIAIPRLPNERNERYEARVIYVSMGADRSLEAVRQKTGKKPGTIRTLELWSTQDGWVQIARDYDDALAAMAAQAHAARYLADLEEHRQRYAKAGKDLFTIAQSLMLQCARAVKGETIEGRDGKTYTIPAMDLTPATLSTAVRALTIAADLEAHALRLDTLLPTLTPEASDGV